MADKRKSSVYLPAETLALLDAEAKRQDRSRSYIVRRLVRDHLPRHTDERTGE